MNTMAASRNNPIQAGPRWVRQTLLLDAVVSGATGLLLALGGRVLGPLLDLPVSLLTYAGIALLPFVAVVYLIARQAEPSLVAVRAVIAANALWVAASILLLLSGWVAPNLLGTGFVLVQAIAVAGFAAVQAMAVRQ